MGPEGPLPISLGPGTPIEDPLSGSDLKELPTVRQDRLSQLRNMLGGRLSYLRRRLERVSSAMESLVSPDDYRIWGNLLLTVENGSRKGLTEIGLTDWEGRDHVIPLKPSRTLRSNASRYFRKASNTGREKRHLHSIMESTGREIADLEKTLEGAQELDAGQLLNLIRDHTKKSESAAEQGRRLKAVVLSGGWRCFVGRNARQNEEVTFGMGRRGDIWFHARGIPGAHVILKMDGRAGNPPAGIMMEAALLAARGSGVSSGVVPVDYTGVQYVNRMKKGKPGQVNYTREKTIFVDLDSK
jgi:predicted ribosome quality control (RQC) complex YloA/Tae2 family protein